MHPCIRWISPMKNRKRDGKWVKENTKTIVPEIRVEGQQLMHLMNTVYFYDEWIDRFNQSATKKGDFHLADGTTREETDFIDATYGSHNYRNGDGFVSSSLGLKENGSMVFVLPDEGVPVDSLFETPDRLKEVLEGRRKPYGRGGFPGSQVYGRYTFRYQRGDDKAGYNRNLRGWRFLRNDR